MELNDYFKQFYPPDWRTAPREFSSMLGGMDRYTGKTSNIFPRIVCADGISLSAQGHFGSYSHPRDDFAETYLTVEVGFIEDAKGEKMAPPESWREWSDGEFPSDVYGYVPVRVVEQFIAEHGGMKPAVATA